MQVLILNKNHAKKSNLKYWKHKNLKILPCTLQELFLILIYIVQNQAKSTRFEKK